MQTYTKQQLEGSVRYAPKCLIGNWNEDVELQKTILKDFVAKKATGSLILDRYQQRMSIALAGVELSRIRDDALVHFGDLIQIAHCDTGAVLCNDVEDKAEASEPQDLRPGENSCSATATIEISQPCARNTFLLSKYKPHRMSPAETYYEDDVLRYGQKIRLVSNSMAMNDNLDATGGPNPLCLFSKPVSTTHYAKYSRHQLVGFTWRDTYDTVWQVVTPDPADRVASQGVEVMAGAPVLLVHCATNKPLCLESTKYPNDFGLELEVSAHLAANNGLPLALEHSGTGRLKGSLPKAETTQNYWTILTGTTIATLPSTDTSAMVVQDILRHVHEGLLKASSGLSGLEKKLVCLDTKGNGDMRADEFGMVLQQVGVALSPDEVDLLVKRFAADHLRVINTKAFLTALKKVDS